MSQSCNSLCRAHLIEQSLCRRRAPGCSSRHSCSCQPRAHGRTYPGAISICLVKLRADLNRTNGGVRADLKINVGVLRRDLGCFTYRRHRLLRWCTQLLHTLVKVLLHLAPRAVQPIAQPTATGEEAFLHVCDFDSFWTGTGDDVCNCSFQRSLSPNVVEGVEHEVWKVGNSHLELTKHQVLWDKGPERKGCYFSYCCRCGR